MARRRRPLPLVVEGQIVFEITPKVNIEGLKRRVELLEHQVREEVLLHIAATVADQITKNIPRGHGSKYNASYASLKSLWAMWASRPQEAGGNFWIGNVEQMNKATGGPMFSKEHGAAWRYGSWFNLEWGREWPNKTGDWIYQENPGGGSPASAKPPGAGPADIEMQKWLGRDLRPKSGSDASNIHRAMSGQDEARRAKANYELTREWVRQSRQRQIETGRHTGRQAHARRLQGLFGKAPIRIGYAEGVRIADQHLPTLMKAALQHIGKAR